MMGVKLIKLQNKKKKQVSKKFKKQFMTELYLLKHILVLCFLF